MNSNDPHPNITQLIRQDIQEISPKPIQDFQLIRAKSGVYVYRCLYDGTPAVAKYLQKEDDRREILNYRILAQHGIPTIETYAFGKATLIMEDISYSEEWRLGIAEDLQDAAVSKILAQWYFTFHENGAAVTGLDTLYFEYDSITEENLKVLIQKFPSAKATLQFILTHCDKLRGLIYKPSFTLTYNDFYWTNLVARKDKSAAMMFDYNLLGKGYRFSDFRNVCWHMSCEAKATFVDEYNRLYFEKHGSTRTESEKLEQSIDAVASGLFSLIVAFTQHEHNPNWGKCSKDEALNGSLLSKAELLFNA